MNTQHRIVMDGPSYRSQLRATHTSTPTTRVTASRTSNAA